MSRRSERFCQVLLDAKLDYWLQTEQQMQSITLSHLFQEVGFAAQGLNGDSSLLDVI